MKGVQHYTHFLLLLVALMAMELPSRADIRLPSDAYLKKITSLLEIAPVEQKQRVHSSLTTFAFLNVNAEQFSQTESTQNLVERVHHLFSKISSIEAPDCPELFEHDVTEEMIEFQKINRHLFDDFDSHVLHSFEALFKGDSGLLAFPVVEWAVNVMPQFTFEEINKMNGKSLEDKIVHFIEHKYSQASLKAYLSRAWDLVDHWDKGLDGKNGLINRIRSDMCYPARLSILE